MLRIMKHLPVFSRTVRYTLLTPGFFVALLTRPTGLHLSPAGSRIVYDEIMKVIRDNWPDQTPEVLPMVFPSWVDAPK